MKKGIVIAMAAILTMAALGGCITNISEADDANTATQVRDLNVLGNLIVKGNITSDGNLSIRRAYMMASSMQTQFTNPKDTALQ